MVSHKSRCYRSDLEHGNSRLRFAHIRIGFCRCYQGPDNGAYYHPLFLRGKQSLVTNIVRIKIKGCGHKTMKLYDSEPDFYAMPSLDNGNQDNDCSSFGSKSTQTIGQPTVCDSTEGFASNYPRPLSLPHALDGCSLMNKNGFPRLISLNEQQCHQPTPLSEGGNSSNPTSIDFVTRLNQSNFVQELAMVCTTLCNLRKDTSLEG